MTFLVGPMQMHLDGHKELTAHNEIIELKPKERVYVPLLHGNAVVKPLVNVGDKVKIGDRIACRDDHFYVPFFAPVSGEVVAIEKHMSCALKPVDHIVIANDGKDEQADLATLDEEAKRDDIIDFMKDKGLVGCGGAGFPTYIKYQTDKCSTLIINAVECEPYITADARMIETRMDDFYRGVKALIKASNCRECLIGIKENKTELIALLKERFKDEAMVKICPLKDVYPMGWERTLVYALLKKRYDKLPIEVGVIVSNATTAIMLAQAMTSGLPIYEKMVTVSGEGVKNPHNVLCRVGTTYKELIEACGGYNENISKLALIAGGPMMGNTVTKDEVAITPFANAVTVLKYEDIKPLACLRCGACIDHCPSGLQPVNINKAFKAKDLDLVKKLKAQDCIECGMCTYVCPSKIAVTEGIRRAKRSLALLKK